MGKELVIFGQFVLSLTKNKSYDTIVAMNNVNQQIVHLLHLQGFETNKAVANSIGVAERTVRRHLKGMIQQRIIRIVAIPNPVSCGFRAWSKIGIKIDPRYLNSVAHTLVEHPAVYFAAFSLGRFDIIIAVHFDTIDQLTHFVNSELAGVKGVVSSESWILASPRKYYSFSWPAPVFAKSKAEYDRYDESVSGNGHYWIDNVDQEIIAVLREDGLARPDGIKSKVSLGESTIRKRMTYMLDNDVYARQIVVLSPQILENEIWVTIGITTNGRDAHEVVDAILKYSTVYLACVSLGRFNVVISARFYNMGLMNDFVTRELPSINGISSTETFVHIKPLKYHNIPLVYPQDNGWTLT